MQSTKWPARHLMGQSKDFTDAKTATEANERQGLNKSLVLKQPFHASVNKAKHFGRRRELDPYSVQFHQRINTDLTGDDWLTLDIVRRRFIDDRDMIRELLMVINWLAHCCANFKRELNAKQKKK